MSKIEWTERTFNPTVGCSKVSTGCANCYAERTARRLKAMGRPEYQDVVDANGWTGHVNLIHERLEIPLRRQKPTTWFVDSMSDVFHKHVPPWFVCEVWQVMRECPQHTFQILTKRPKRMLRLLKTYIANHEFGIEPLPNVWLGVTAENQQTADERIPLLLQTPAAVRFVSCEPLLGAVDLQEYLHCGISWCIIGAESGPRARPMDEDWARRLILQCKQQQTPVFYKQKMKDGKKLSTPMIDGKRYIELPQVTDNRNAS